MEVSDNYKYLRGLDEQNRGVRVSEFLRTKFYRLPYKDKQWSKILKIKGYTSVLLTLRFSQNNQASLHTYIINTGYNSAKIQQIGFNNFPAFSAVPIRITQGRSTYSDYDVEIRGIYKDETTSNLIVDCKYIELGGEGPCVPFKVFMEGSGTVVDEIISSHKPS